MNEVVAYIVFTLKLDGRTYLNGVFLDGRDATKLRDDLKSNGLHTKLYIIKINKGLTDGMLI